MQLKLNTPMIHKPLSYLLDGISGATFLGGIMTGHNIAIFLGGLASLLAVINHAQQFIDRLKKK